MEMNLVAMWHGMNTLVRAVVVVLTLQALACIYVAIDRLFLLIVSYYRGRKFARRVGPLLAARRLTKAPSTWRRNHRGSHLAGFILTGVETFDKQRRNGQGAAKAAELAGRALERKAETLSGDLNRGMNILASTGSTAPFVGLLGTVLGILNAFKLVGQQGSGGIGTIGVAIAEALIVTGYGLMVAIPSVLLFNWLSGRLAKYEAGLAARARASWSTRWRAASKPGARSSDVASGYDDEAPAVKHGVAGSDHRVMRAMTPKWAGKGYRARPVMNVTPLVDVVLVLLIIFMVVIPAMQQGVNIELPGITNTDDKKEGGGQPFTLSVSKDGEIYFEEDKVAWKDLEATLKAAAQARARQAHRAARRQGRGVRGRAAPVSRRAAGRFPRRVDEGEPPHRRRGNRAPRQLKEKQPWQWTSAQPTRARRADASPEMNVTPLVDVVLVLLIIFMVLTAMMNDHFWVHVPEKDQKDSRTSRSRRRMTTRRSWSP